MLLAICVAMAGVVKGGFLFLMVLAAVLFGVGTGAVGDVEELQEALSALPLIGNVYRRLFNPTTFYTEEARTIFEESIHRIVLDVVAGVLTIAKMTPLTEAQKELRRVDEI